MQSDRQDMPPAPRASRALRAVVALVLLALTATFIARSVLDARRTLAVSEACAPGLSAEAVERATRDLVGSDEAGRQAAECRCWALLALQRKEECAEVIADAALADGASLWLPDLELVRLTIARLRLSGDNARALELAKRANDAHPEDPRLADAEVALLLSELPRQEAMALAIERGKTENILALRRVSLALHLLETGHTDDADAALADEVPRLPPVRDQWFDQKMKVAAKRGSVPQMRALVERWQKHGGSEARAEASYAMQLSMEQLKDPAEKTFVLLERALANGALELTFGQLLARRLLEQHVMAGRMEQAEAVLATVKARFPDFILTLEDVQRSAQLEDKNLALRDASFVFDAEVAGTLLVSAGADAPVDAPLEPFAIAPGAPVKLRRLIGPAPLRYVLRDGAGGTLAAGRAWPEGEVTRVRLPAAAKATPPTPPFVSQRRQADGRTRVFVVLLDCADWRLVRFFAAQGKLPVLDALAARGQTAVLSMNPPLTAMAMRALVYPQESLGYTLVGLAHRLGSEIGGLASVGDNPFEPLSSLLPPAEDLFSVLGSGERVALNMLFAHGGIDAGRHGERVGPRGERRLLQVSQSRRALTDEERALLAGLPDDVIGPTLHLFESMAAQLDAARSLAEGKEIDALLLRVEALDLLTHGSFQFHLKPGPYDDKTLIDRAYRYLDGRIGELDAALDEDDVLIVMSDHGIQSAMRHDENALFIAAGRGLEPKRAEGTPELRSVPRYIAELLRQRTEWPTSGLTELLPKEAP